MGKFFSLYRFPEIIQIFGISVSMLFFMTELPGIFTLILWSVSILSSISSAFWLNDYFDFQDDLHNPRKIRHESRRKLLIMSCVSLGISLVTGLIVSRGLFFTGIATGIISILYSTPFIRLKSRLFFPFILHFLMGIVFFQSAIHTWWINVDTEIVLMGIFWGLILSSGSLGNELVDHEVDKRMNIITIANAFPTRARTFMLIVLGASLVTLLTNMILMELIFSVIFCVLISFSAIYFKGKSLDPGQFRRAYRIGFVSIIIVFHLEMALRG